MFNKPYKPLTIGKSSVSAPISETPVEPAAKRRKITPTESESAVASTENFPQPSSRAAVISQQRKPLHSLPNPPSSPEHGSKQPGGIASYYTVLWRNPTAKKNKTWNGDGVLAVNDGTATFYDSSGRLMGKKDFSKPLLPGSTLGIGGKDVEIDSCISRQEFVTVLKPKSKETSGIKRASSKNTDSSTQAPQPATLPIPRGGFQDQIKGAVKKEKVDSTKTPVPQTFAQKLAASKAAFKPVIKEVIVPGSGETPKARHDPAAPNAIVFKRPKKAPVGHQTVDVVLDPALTAKLRPHQREGVKFMYECVMGLRDFGGQGCILADDMGLGKTLQTIALLWTLIKQNPVYKAAPVVKKALIVCPVSLIKNWKKEFKKWLYNTNIGVLEFEDPKTTRLRMFDGKVYNIMIIGYERLRLVAEELAEAHDIDIVICDEGHRLKTVKNKSAKAIEALNTPRRVILSGTPIQNDLGEFYAMVNFVNDGCLGSAKAFLKDFENPIMKSRQPNATKDDVERGEEASNELAQTTSPFILRRTADILSDFLPAKTEYVLFCKPTREQAEVYRSVVKSPMFTSALGSTETALQLITILKKLCNSPALLRSTAGTEATTSKSIETLNEMLPSGLSRYYQNAMSSKIRLLDILLQQIRTKTDEKVVLVSNYTSTLNLMANLLQSSGLKFLRLDGSVPAKQRQGLVDQFNRAKPSHTFAFLLSAKAGGVGIDLTGASRLVLFDVDWNPATDDQAIARVHRQGQTRATKIYRFLVKGSLEEKIWQRQIVKRGLADSIMEGRDGVDGGSVIGKAKAKAGKTGKSGKNTFTQEELRDLFRFDEQEGLRTHDLIECPCGGEVQLEQAEEETADSDEAFYREVKERAHSEPEEDLPDISAIVSASQLSSNYPEDQSGITSPVKRARDKRNSGDRDGQAEELMKYTHLDTTGVARLEDGSAELEAFDEAIGDACLMHLLRQPEEVTAGSVGYVFRKMTGTVLRLGEDEGAAQEQMVKSKEM